MTDSDRSFVIRAFVIVLSISALAVIAVLLAGLFTPVVDNNLIFKILDPMSQTITGALVSILSGLIAVRTIGKKDGDN
jgi:hypothetical protein